MPNLMPTPYQADYEGINRRRALAQALMQQGMQAPQAPQSGRIAVPMPKNAALLNALQGGVGGYLMKKTNDDQTALIKQLQTQQTQDVQGVMQAMQGTPEGSPVGPEGPQIPTPAVAPDMNLAISRALQSQTPQAQALASPIFNAQQQNQKLAAEQKFKAAENDENRAAREQALTLAREQQAALQAERLALQQQMQEATLANQRTIADQGNQTRRDVASMNNQTRLDVLAGKPPKSIPPSAIKDLTEVGGTATDFNRLSDTFKDDFGGNKFGIVGDAQNFVGRNIGMGYGDQAQWWQDYQNQKNIVRNRLFGSALTVTEKAEFDKAQINPGMLPSQITENLARQKDSAARAARKLAGAYKAGGYSEEQIEAALGISMNDLAAPKAPRSPGARPGATGGWGGGWSIVK